ncbi:hypothetical protein BHE90_016220 [Fusarium euwallaceae]|uniref:Uncharacterized protein n=1 Tax=Fusarium euwallaceae TaxID=1147111 RepID=A0A430L0Z0_9HYPO|nr:hypothetical protein BHE90_016220 [Fusarium euwallaceae]
MQQKQPPDFTARPSAHPSPGQPASDREAGEQGVQWTGVKESSRAVTPPSPIIERVPSKLPPRKAPGRAQPTYLSPPAPNNDDDDKFPIRQRQQRGSTQLPPRASTTPRPSSPSHPFPFILRPSILSSFFFPSWLLEADSSTTPISISSKQQADQQRERPDGKPPVSALLRKCQRLSASAPGACTAAQKTRHPSISIPSQQQQ